MMLSTTSERGASGSPAPAGPRAARPGRRLAAGFLAAACVIAAMVSIGTVSSSVSSESAVGADRADIGGVGGVASTAAIAELERRTANDPDDLPAWQQLSRRYLRQATATGDPAFYDLTRNALDRARALAPGDPATTVTEGALALSLHDFALALAHGRTAHEQVADDPDPLAILIDASVELGHYDEAEDHLSELLTRRPGSAALSRLSYLRELHGDPEGAGLAMLQAEQATSAPEDRATIATLIGDQLLASRDLTGAAAAYERARLAAPGLAATEIGRARVSAAQGRLDEAITTLAALVERSPAPAPATVLGELQQAAGRDDEAADSFALARAGTELLAGAGSTVDLESALFAADHGDPTEAVTLAEAAYRTRRTIFTADALGWALTRAGRPAEALPYVEEARRLGTRSPALHVHAAVALAATGDPARAAVALRTAFESSAWQVPALRPKAAELAERLGVPVPEDWRP
jgi:predicted Zn-dependent protease